MVGCMLETTYKSFIILHNCSHTGVESPAKHIIGYFGDDVLGQSLDWCKQEAPLPQRAQCVHRA